MTVVFAIEIHLLAEICTSFMRIGFVDFYKTSTTLSSAIPCDPFIST